MSLTLSHDELVDLTHYKRRDKQVAALEYMGIEHSVRPDGTPLVDMEVLTGRRSQRNKGLAEGPWEKEGIAPDRWLKQNAADFFYSDTDIAARASDYVPPGPDDSGVYFLLCGDTIVYVGLAQQISIRLTQHYDADRFLWNRYFYIAVPYILCPSIESYYINRILPPENIKIPPLGIDLDRHV